MRKGGVEANAVGVAWRQKCVEGVEISGRARASLLLLTGTLCTGGWVSPQDRSRRAENLVPTGIRSRTVHPVAQSLYQLSYGLDDRLI